METLVWTPQYNIGIKVLDEEHHALFDSVNRIQTAMSQQQDRAAIMPMLGELFEQTSRHFKGEEAMMADNGYSGAMLHSLKHQHLLEQAVAFLTRYNRGAGLNDYSLGFLRDWLVTHIQDTDKLFALWLREHGKM